MPKIMDLPLEILELIFSHLISITAPTEWSHRLHRAYFEAQSAAYLRLVCRAWSDWLYEHHLYRTLTFDCASRSLAFIDFLGRRSKMLPRAKCQYLEVDFFWADESPPQYGNYEMITSEILESLLELFSDTITTLDLKFIDYFTLSSQTIKAIGRVRNLYHLRLDISRWPSGDFDYKEAHPSCFHSLMAEAQVLKSLHVALVVSLPSKPDLMVARTSHPAIAHLAVEVDYVDREEFLAISTVLQPGLKFLSLQDYRETDFQLLLPVYETLRETLQGLSVTRTRPLQPILRLSFPKLRVLAIHGFDASFDLMTQALFSQSPIETIAIGCVSARVNPENFTLDTFANWPQLKKLVFMKAPPGYSPPSIFREACKAHRVKCISVDHSELSLLMNL